ncbi:MAG: hypothetical protein HXX09_08000 [Bacteroidetes bacterium]|nr:hypothetical protein [Bacteroidota bacterium]
MISTGFSIYLVFIIALLFAMTGVILFVIGLVGKRKPLWISGIISMALAIVLFLSALLFGIYKFVTIIEKAAKSNYQYLDYHYKESPYYKDKHDSLETFLDSNYRKPISGLILGNDDSEVFVKIYPNKSITNQEIDLIKLEKSNYKKPNSIFLLISFEQKYKGSFTLKAYDASNTLLNSSKIMVQMNANMEGSLEFVFPKSTNFSIISYFTLDES